jgi:hypothetical protein
MTPEAFFAGHEDAEQLFHAVQKAIAKIGGAALTITKSQIAFRRNGAFAWAWTPGRYLRGAHPPLVLSLVLARRDPSPRWKEIAEPRPGRYMHHLELRAPSDVDDQVSRWLAEASAVADARSRPHLRTTTARPRRAR